MTPPLKEPVSGPAVTLEQPAATGLLAARSLIYTPLPSWPQVANRCRTPSFPTLSDPMHAAAYCSIGGYFLNHTCNAPAWGASLRPEKGTP